MSTPNHRHERTCRRDRAGVAGLTAAYLLQRRYDVLLFEAAPRLGGHAHTHDVGTTAVDSGFIVHNERTRGSREYVERAAKGLTAVHVGTPVRAVRRGPDHVEVRDDADQSHVVDRVVVATHPGDALGLLTDPTELERRVLGAFPYSRNETWLHTDDSLLPTAAAARASWNYLKPSCSGGEQVVVSYDMSRLMRLGGTTPYLVTLNATDRVAEDSVLAKMTYEQPVYTTASVAAQKSLPALVTTRTAYAGAYHGWGFHEDGCAAGVTAAAAFGVTW